MDYIKNKKILLVDDELQLLQMVKTILIEEGFTSIKTAFNCKDTIISITKDKPDIIILDVMLPDGDGFSLLSAIRKISDIPVLFLTARGEAEDKFIGFGLGADDYIIKPFLEQELVFRIKAILKRTYKNECPTFSLSSCNVDLKKLMY